VIGWVYLDIKSVGLRGEDESVEASGHLRALSLTGCPTERSTSGDFFLSLQKRPRYGLDHRCFFNSLVSFHALAATTQVGGFFLAL